MSLFSGSFCSYYRPDAIFDMIIYDKSYKAEITLNFAGKVK